MTSAYTLLAGAKVSLTGKQKENADVIADVFSESGLNDRAIMAAITNAYAESNLDACAVSWARVWSGCNTGPCPPGSEESVGLFQLNTRGLGAGMSVEDRKKPRLNTARVVTELKRVERQYGPVVSGASTLAGAVEAFCRYIEKPANVARKVAERIELARLLFPAYMAGSTGGLFPTTSPPPAAGAEEPGLPIKKIVLVSGAVFFGILGLYALKRVLT